MSKIWGVGPNTTLFRDTLKKTRPDSRRRNDGSSRLDDNIGVEDHGGLRSSIGKLREIMLTLLKPSIAPMSPTTTMMDGRADSWVKQVKHSL